jgi:Ca-activated chloride channel family protein
MKGMIDFEYWSVLYGLLSIPVFVLLFVFMQYIKRKRLRKYGDVELVNQLMPEFSKSRPILKFIAYMLALALFIIGFANPKIGSKLKEDKREGVEVIIALDVSKSMLAEDIKPNRLSRAKRAISKLIDELNDDKIGLIVFAGDAYTQLPITTDYASAKMFLSSISPDIVPVPGTSIGKAIDLAFHSYSPDNEKNKALIIITDGEDHESEAVTSAQSAAEQGIFVHTIGMGKPEGVPIPISGKFGQKEFHMDKEGKVVISKLNEQQLKQIASAGKGAYVRANNARTGLDKIFEEINNMEKEEFESEIYSDYVDRFQYFIGFALFFFLLEFLILDRKNRWFKNVNLFKTE